MNRAEAISSLAAETFDVLVVGGGIVGAGVAFDAATRGLRVALVEREDFGSGTSSRSSKLIHGGLRYLRRLDIGLVREGLRERRELMRMAPHLVRQHEFLVPRFDSLRLGIRAGLTLYDFLSAGSGLPRHRSVGPDEVAGLAPALRPSDGGLAYWDAKTDDARLVWSIVRSAAEAGAVVVNYAELKAIETSSGRAAGGVVVDKESGSEIDVRARAVVNATGVWADEVRRLEDPQASADVRPSRGTHLVFRRSSIPVEAALVLPSPDHRFVFVIPWENDTTLVGTTDVEHAGALDAPGADDAEIEYLLAAVNEVISSSVTLTDVIATYASLRPLIGKSKRRTKDISRRHKVDMGSAGVVTVMGGKLTTWRPMAIEAVDAALTSGSFDQRPRTKTHELRLAGAAFREGVVPALEAVLADLGIDASHATRLYERYGAHAAEVLKLVRTDPALARPLHLELPYMRAEAEYAILSEAARTIDDVISRRLRVTLTSSDYGTSCSSWVWERLELVR
jgi:glycerol-3-phosphate dehydrogenase